MRSNVLRYREKGLTNVWSRYGVTDSQAQAAWQARLPNSPARPPAARRRISRAYRSDSSSVLLTLTPHRPATVIMAAAPGARAQAAESMMMRLVESYCISNFLEGRRFPFLKTQNNIFIYIYHRFLTLSRPPSTGSFCTAKIALFQGYCDYRKGFLSFARQRYCMKGYLYP
jgi:hypothetical protein